MSLEIYSKDIPTVAELTESSKKRDRIFGFSLLSVGLASISFAVLPLLIWQFVTLPSFSSKVQNFPIPIALVLGEGDQDFSNVQVTEDPSGFSYFTTSFKPSGNRPKEFLVSVPKLDIEKAVAKTDSLNFYDNLSHFPGTALPGEKGNVFITGHSVLPQFADPDNYHAIFTKLPSLEAGDVINVELNGKTYQYIVQYKKIVDPKDLSVLKPISKNAKNLTLMTCVPPGTSLKRIVVVSSLI